MIIGYARVSSTGQSLEVQEDALRAEGCERIFSEKKSGTTTEGRDELARAIDLCREGDTFLVTRLDRLARSSMDLQAIVARIAAKGAGFRCIQQGAVDTTSSMGKLVLAMLAAIAEFETDLRKERQKEGIEKAKANGVYKGRKATVDRAAVRALKAEGLGATEIAKRLGVGRRSVYNVLAEEPA